MMDDFRYDEMFDDVRGDEFNYPDLRTLDADRFNDLYWDAMVRMGRRAGFKYDIAELAASDVMIKIFVAKKCHYSPAKGPFPAYLKAMVVNFCRNERRRSWRYLPTEDASLELFVNDNYTTPTVEDAIRATEHREMIDAALRTIRGKMPSAAYDVLRLTILDEAKPREIARQLGVSTADIAGIKTQWLPRYRCLLRQLDGRPAAC